MAVHRKFPVKLSQTLERLSFGELQTLVYIKLGGSPGKAAQLLGRQHSTVLKQINSLNEDFEQQIGEPLAVKQARGENYVFSPSGDAVAEFAEDLLRRWSDRLEERRSIVGGQVTVATTTFTLPILVELWSEVREKTSRPVDLRVKQIRTKDFDVALDSRDVDLIIGGRVVEAASDPELPNVEHHAWDRVKPILYTNLSPIDFPGETISKEQLAKRDLVLPAGGIIVDLVSRWYGEEYADRLRLPPRAQDVFYSVALLQSGIVRGFMLALTGAVEAAQEFTAKILVDHAGRRAQRLRKIGLGKGFNDLEVVTGLYGRKGERARYEKADPHHPLALFWKVAEGMRVRGQANP